MENKPLILCRTLSTCHCNSKPDPKLPHASFNLPKKTLDQIDKLNKDFIWGHFERDGKLHLIKWDKITKAKNEGGLGIKNSHYLNAAHMSKLRWDLHTNSNTGKSWIPFLRKKIPLSHKHLSS